MPDVAGDTQRLLRRVCSAWLHLPPEELALWQCMKVLFKASRKSLGSRTLARKLREEGFKIGRDRTWRLMKTLNLPTGQAEAQIQSDDG